MSEITDEKKAEALTSLRTRLSQLKEARTIYDEVRTAVQETEAEVTTAMSQASPTAPLAETRADLIVQLVATLAQAAAISQKIVELIKKSGRTDYFDEPTANLEHTRRNVARWAIQELSRPTP